MLYEWVLAERQPAFLNSDLFCEYKLASLLARVEESREKQPNMPLSKSVSNIAISSELNGGSGVSYSSLGSKKAMSALKKFLAGTSGENDYLFWTECEGLSSGDMAALKEIKEKYTRPGAKCELAKGRWVQRSQPVTRDDIFALQTSVLHSLVSYCSQIFAVNEPVVVSVAPTEEGLSLLCGLSLVGHGCPRRVFRLNIRPTSHFVANIDQLS